MLQKVILFTIRLHFLINGLDKNDEQRIHVNLDEFLGKTNQLDRWLPDGFIFHTSRCGSSAVVNYLQKINSVDFIPEAQPISLFTMKNNELLKNWDEQKLNGLSYLFDIYKKAISKSKNNQMIIKFASWCLIDCKNILQNFSSVPTVILVRNPVECNYLDSKKWVV